jgi:hypothetical protein
MEDSAYISEKVTSLGLPEYAPPRWSSSSRAASNELRITRCCPSTETWLIGPAGVVMSLGGLRCLLPSLNCQGNSPYSFAHSSNTSARLPDPICRRFPTIGSGAGPGGNGRSRNRWVRCQAEMPTAEIAARNKGERKSVNEIVAMVVGMRALRQYAVYIKGS